MDAPSPGPRQDERQRAPRYPCRLDLEMEWGSQLLHGRVRDISASGMFIESPDPLWVGAGFAARLKLDAPMNVDCQVKRVEPGRGMGVIVSIREGDGQQKYLTLLQSLSQPGS